MIVDALGNPLALSLTGGQVHDIMLALAAASVEPVLPALLDQSARAVTREVANSVPGSMRQRIGAQLHFEYLRIGFLAALAVKVGARAGRSPEAAAFPSR
jgi:hypothetical protein